MADEKYWTYKAATLTPESPPPNCNITAQGWHSLSPGMRREIWRDYERSHKAKAP